MSTRHAHAGGTHTTHTRQKGMHRGCCKGRQAPRVCQIEREPSCSPLGKTGRAPRAAPRFLSVCSAARISAHTAYAFCSCVALVTASFLAAGLTAEAILFWIFLLADTAKPPEMAWAGPTAMREEPPLLVREMRPTEMALARAFPGFLSESAAERARESATTPAGTRVEGGRGAAGGAGVSVSFRDVW